jgi:CRISPR-associated protein Cas5d
VYWKPTIVWVIDKVRIVKPIRTQTKAVKPVKYGGGNELAIYTYLAETEYQVEAHFEWNLNRTDMANDRNDGKHWSVANRMIERGGRRDVFLGARECQGYVEPCLFGEGEGFYDNLGEVAYGLMFHGFDYPTETGKDELNSRFWRPKMIDGIVEFIRPEQCSIRKFIKKMKPHPPNSNGLEEESLKAILTEEGLEQ